MMHAAFVAAALALLLAAGWRDLLTRHIPDRFAAGLLALAVLARGVEGIAALGLSLVAAVLLFAVLAALFMRGLLGGGDVKLMVALAVGLPPAAVWNFVVATGIAGGVVAALYLLAGRLLPAPASAPRRSLLARVVAVEAWRIRTRRPMPYALAIAAGGALVLLSGFGA